MGDIIYGRRPQNNKFISQINKYNELSTYCAFLTNEQPTNVLPTYR